MTILVHGGASDHALTSKEAKVYRIAMRQILEQGDATLSAEENVLGAVTYLENHSHFNAGMGSALAKDGLPYLDASIALSNGNCGAIASSLQATSAISAARRVMYSGKDKLLVGEKLDEWLKEEGEATSDPSTRITKKSLRQLAKWRQERTFATVGAVALDGDGNLAAATSTGGLIGKTPGRVGDSAIIGAGTYCSKECAISFTGDGEGIMARGSALRIALAIEAGEEVEAVIARELRALKDADYYAGCIVLLASGNGYMMRNCRTLLAARKDDRGIYIDAVPLLGK